MGQVKVRESNIELLRNISMFMILVIHANFVALPKISYEELMSNTTPSVVRYFIESIGIVAVNVFVFISGWFGVRTRTKSVLSFIYQILFFLVGGGAFSLHLSVKRYLMLKSY
jgi:surface polysaccharide O-acyltransferase-like enzyme